jgi:hypothetical protein
MPSTKSMPSTGNIDLGPRSLIGIGQGRQKLFRCDRHGRSMTSDHIWSEPMCLLQRSSCSAEKLEKLRLAAAENHRLQQGTGLSRLFEVEAPKTENTGLCPSARIRS